MFTAISRNAQTLVCMTLSAVIVSVSLSLGVFAAERAAHGSSVRDRRGREHRVLDDATVLRLHEGDAAGWREGGVLPPRLDAPRYPASQKPSGGWTN